MNSDTLATSSSKAPANGPGSDLTQDVAAAVERLPGDRIRVRRVSPSVYRCNWLTSDRSGRTGSMFIESYRIRQSRLFRATIGLDGKLALEDLTIGASRN